MRQQLCHYRQGRRKLVGGGAALNGDDNLDERRVKKIYIKVNLRGFEPLLYNNNNNNTIMEMGVASQRKIENNCPRV